MNDGPGRFEISLAGAFAAVGTLQLADAALRFSPSNSLQYGLALTAGIATWIWTGRTAPWGRRRRKATRTG